MVDQGRSGDNHATIGGTTGAVVRSGRLTLLVGDANESFDTDALLPIEALKTADRLKAEGSWEFDDVASALHQLVIDHDPAGVAAFLDGEVEAMVFLFDQADAVEFDPEQSELADVTIEANGRTGWTTELVSGPLVRLRLRGSGDSLGWTSLREGLVPGDSAIVTVAAYVEGYDYDADQPVHDETPSAGGQLDPVPTDHAPIEDVATEDAPIDDVAVEDAPIEEALDEQTPVGASLVDGGSGTGSDPDPDPDPDLEGDIDPDLGDDEPWVEPGAAEPVAAAPDESEAMGSPNGTADPSAAALANATLIVSGDGTSENDAPPQGDAGHDQESADERSAEQAETDQGNTDQGGDEESAEDEADTGAQRTMVVDPSQIGLTRLGTEGQPSEAQPPPPGGASPLPATGPNAAPSPHQPPAPSSAPPPPGVTVPPGPAPVPPPDSPPPPGAPAPAPVNAPPPPPAATPIGAPRGELPPPPATPPPASPSDAPPPASPAPGPTPAPPPSTPGPEVAVPAPPGPSGPPVNLPPPPRGPGGMPRPPAGDGGGEAQADSWTPTPPPPGVPAPPPPRGPSPQAFAPPAPAAGPPPGPGPGPGQPPSPGQFPAPAPPAPSAWPAPSAPGGPPASGPPPVGFLTDQTNGQRHAISGTTVVGSDPGGDAEVVIGAATMITVEDPSVHEVHVRIKVSGHSVSVEDAGFGNAWLQNVGGPMELLDTVPKPLNPGSQLRLGSKTLLFKPATGPGS